MNLKNESIELLDAVLASPERLDDLIPKLQQTIWSDESDKETPELEILRDLAYDLEYYVSDPDMRKEDPTFYGPERALEEIQLARRKLMGLKSPNRVAGGFSPPAPTPPGMRVRTGRFDRITGP